MATYERNNAWNKGGDFSNSDLLWYAKGVGKMMSRSLDDPKSWWFYAAIHGEYVNPKTAWYPRPLAFPAWGYITAPPHIPTTPLPSPQTMALYWNQCQHGSWYFFPWHRGYLLSIEAQLRQDIVALGGPATWALPYWDYFGGEAGSQYQMPPAFAHPTLPDGSPNPLFIAQRYGPNGDGNIYVPTPASKDLEKRSRGPVTEVAMRNTVFTGTNRQTPPPGFGGPDTDFSHSGNGFGNFESNPHNLVHVYVGGQSNNEHGLMADPNTAALDPIFYLHHGNIDRLWAVWNASGNANPSEAKWLKGPVRQFAMPGPTGQPWYYTPGQMTTIAPLGYNYQEMTALPAAPALQTERLRGLGATQTDVENQAALHQVPRTTELLGASANGLRIQGKDTAASVQLNTSVHQKVLESFTSAARGMAAPPDGAFLKLENITGTFDATVLNVYIDAPAPTTAAPAATQSVRAGTVALFGLRQASLKDGQHGGDGLTFTLDITPIIDQLHVAQGLDIAALQVHIVPDELLSAKGEVQVGRISVFRQAF